MPYVKGVVPKHNNRDALVPGPFQPIFDSAVSGHANSYIVDNVSRALVDKLTMKFAEIIAQDNDVYDLCKLYEDLSLTDDERASMFREVIQSVDLWKIRCNAEDKKKSGVDNENKLNRLSEQILDSIMRFWRIMDSSQELFLMNFFSSSGLHLPVMF